MDIYTYYKNIYVFLYVCVCSLFAKHYRINTKRFLELKLGQNTRVTNLQRFPTFQKFLLTFLIFRFFRLHMWVGTHDFLGYFSFRFFVICFQEMSFEAENCSESSFLLFILDLFSIFLIFGFCFFRKTFSFFSIFSTFCRFFFDFFGIFFEKWVSALKISQNHHFYGFCMILTFAKFFRFLEFRIFLFSKKVFEFFCIFRFFWIFFWFSEFFRNFFQNFFNFFLVSQLYVALIESSAVTKLEL